MSQYLGDISAYALAVSQGYTGTEEEYAELMASYATVGQTAVTAAQTATTKASEAATSATTATNKASEATTAATTATTKAGEASTSASTATSAKDTAVSASQTATTKATEATTAAATATSAKTDAVAANTAAQSAKTAAQTAQTGAETAAASVQSSAAQIQTNAEDIAQLMSELTAVNKDLTVGFVPNYANVLEDWTIASATALDESTQIIPPDDTPSKIIHISNTDGALHGASIDLGALFKPKSLGTYHIHFKARCCRNSAYAYQAPTVNFYQYDNTSLKGSYTQAIQSPVADESANKYVEYVKTIEVTASTSNFNIFRIYCQTKFDFWIKDIYIIKGDDNSYGYCRKLLDADDVNDLIVESGDTAKTTLKLAVIGDSISDSVRAFPEKWHYFLHQKNGYIINNLAVSGSGYFGGSNAGGTTDHQFYNQALLIDSDADIAIVFGGFNDLSRVVKGDVTIGTKTDSGTTTIGGCINKTIDNLLTVNPLIHIAIALPTPWQGMNAMIPSNNEYHDAVFGMINVIEEICAYRGIPCLDLWRYSGLRPWVEAFRTEYYVATNDGTHPNTKGHEQFIYPHMREFLREINWQNI